MADSEYQKRQDGDSTVFEVTPASAPKNITMVVFLVVPVLIFGGLALASGSVLFIMVVAAVAAFFVYLGLFKDPRPQGHRSKSTFRVSSSTIQSNGRTFNKNEIHRLIIKNGVTKNVMEFANIAAMQGGATALGRQYELSKVAVVSHALELETGGKAYILAGGMNETTAYGLMKDVGKIIGF